MEATYNKKEFEQLVTEILKRAGFDVKLELGILVDQSAKKWYEKKYRMSFSEIKENTIYGVVIDNIVEFDLKVGKIENLLKTFLTTFARKHKELEFTDDGLKYITSEEILKRVIEKNRERVSNGLFYTTLYGIGMWSIFCVAEKTQAAKNLSKYLTDKCISFTNEYSDAGWVYRFKINKSIELHNELLTNFNIQQKSNGR